PHPRHYAVRGALCLLDPLVRARGALASRTPTLMPKPFLLESFEKHKAKGIARFRMGELEEAKYHFLKAAEYLLQLAKESEGKLREARMKQAQELITLAKTVKERR